MERNEKILVIITLLALIGIALAASSCEKSEPVGRGTSDVSQPDSSQAAAVELCTKCGQIAGSDKCCKAGTEKCSACGLDKGSPGCCKLPSK